MSFPTSEERISSASKFSAGMLPATWLRAGLLSPPVIVSFALAIRVIFVVAGHQYQFSPAGDHWGFGWETGRVARSIAIGHGFGSPFQPRETGPTSFLPPLYPYLVAGVFRLFGVYSDLSGLILLLINSLAGALTAGVIFRIGDESVHDVRVAATAAWMWALFPMTIWPVRWVWETSLSTLLLTCIFYYTLRRRSLESYRGWIYLGFLWGVAALMNMSLVSFMPFSLLWLALKCRRDGKAPWKQAAAASLVMLALCIPWTVRNALRFHRFIFVRGGGAVTFRDGNGPEGNGAWIARKDPSNNPSELALFQQLGETGYVELMKSQGEEFVRREPDRYLLFCVRRFLYFWSGPPDEEKSAATDFRNLLGLAFSLVALVGLVLTIRDKTNGALLFALLLVSYPLTFYLILVFFRYRHPIEPEMTLLCTYSAFSLLGLKSKKSTAASG